MVNLPWCDGACPAVASGFIADDNGDKNSVELENGFVEVIVDGADVPMEPEESDALKFKELGDELMEDN